MKSPLFILHLEDNPLDAELALCALEAEGFTVKVLHVDRRDEFLSALDAGGFDLILSDYSLPDFDGMSALAIVRERCPDIPFILLSGTLGEELAIETLKAGATDYVLKERTSRLGPSVRRALAEANERAERRRLEDQLRQSQKMEAIGRLAGGIAHDFNNLLTAILGYSHILLNRCGEESPMRTELEEIERAGQRAATLTNQLLAFTRKQILQPQLMDLNDLVRNLQKMLRRLIGEDIELAICLGEGTLNVKANPGQVEQVIMNLVVNARDAMPVGGRIVIETHSIESDGIQEGLQPGCYAVLTVRDNGCGIAEAIRSRIFEPFFTTKESGKGTGLGLSMVYGIVKQSGGDVRLDSQPGAGATFNIYLPLISESIDADVTSAGLGHMPRGTETILLVEDDPSVRSLAALVLRELGYTVIEAGNGHEALYLSHHHQGPIDLVVSDMVMPQMSGKSLTDQVKILRPKAKILLISGYTGEFIVNHGEPGLALPFLSKPFTPKDLAHKVREVLTPKAASNQLSETQRATDAASALLPVN